MKYLTIWRDSDGQIQQCARRTLDYACEDFRRFKVIATHVELLRADGETLAEWSKEQ